MIQEQILEYLSAHREEMLADICDLIRINSERQPAVEDMPYGEGNARVLALALEKAAGYGFPVKNYENYVGCIDFGDKEKQLDILAHLDVVPAVADEWKITPPFEPKVVGDRLYGRGSADDKGPAIAALYAMRAVKELGIPLAKNVRLILGCDEECGSSDIAYYYSKEEEAPMTFSPDAEFPVINIEKGHYVASFSASWDEQPIGLAYVLSVKCGTKFNVIPGECETVLSGTHRAEVLPFAAQVQGKHQVEIICEDIICPDGSEGCKLVVKGTSGHAASPEAANNALTASLELLSALPLADCAGTKAIKALSGLFPHGDYAGAAAGVAMQDEVSGPLTISLNMLELNESGVAAFFDCRFPICGNQENLVEVLERKAQENGMSLTESRLAMPHYVPSDSHFVSTLLKCYEMYKHKAGGCVAIGGGTYVHELKNGVAFGPVELDTVTNLHGNDESIPIEDLIVSSAIYAQAIIELCKTE